MNPIIFPIYNSMSLFKGIQSLLSYEKGEVTFHHFPDGETSVIIYSDVRDRDVIFLATLDRPNTKILPLILASETARSLGAKSIKLIAPYLAYMREDKQFFPGGSISSHYFSSLISRYFDSILTIDPHLHRIHDLSEVYSIPACVLHATDPIANWIDKNTENPLIIGPDQESQQWIRAIAQRIRAPYVLLTKNRKGDRDIKVELPSLDAYKAYTPVLVDDIISSGRTMIEPVKQLKNKYAVSPICIGVHAVFADNAYQDLVDAGAARVVTSNTIEHISNAIDVSELIALSIEDQAAAVN